MKVHVITDVPGRPAVIHLTPGNAAGHRRPLRPQAADPRDKARYKDRWRIEAAFCRLKDFPPCR